MQFPKNSWKTHHTLMLGVLFIGLIIRFHGLVWTLPYLFHGDEHRVVSQGINLYENGTQVYESDITNMTNYPPLRSWEIALMRNGLVTFLGAGDVGIAEQTLYGRMMSLFYALLTIVFLYKLGYQITQNPFVGLTTALFFAVWAQSVTFGQRAIVDGTGLMFFALAAWLSVVSYQKLSIRWLFAAGIAGIFAGLGKYNYALVLVLPFFVAVYFLYKNPQKTLKYLAPPALIAMIPLGFAVQRLVSQDDFYYFYFNQSAQLEAQVRTFTVQELPPDDPQWDTLYELYPITYLSRFEQNFTTFTDFVPVYILGLAFFGMIYLLREGHKHFDGLPLFFLGIFLVIFFIGFSYFRIAEGRQLMGLMVFVRCRSRFKVFFMDFCRGIFF